MHDIPVLTDEIGGLAPDLNAPLSYDVTVDEPLPGLQRALEIIAIAFGVVAAVAVILTTGVWM